MERWKEREGERHIYTTNLTLSLPLLLHPALYVRVGVHKEGTCFFHSILHALNPEGTPSGPLETMGKPLG